MHTLVVIAVFLASFSGGLCRAQEEDDSNLEELEMGNDDFSLELDEEDEKAAEKPSDTTGRGELDNFATQNENAKLDLGNENVAPQPEKLLAPPAEVKAPVAAAPAPPPTLVIPPSSEAPESAPPAAMPNVAIPVAAEAEPPPPEAEASEAPVEAEPLTDTPPPVVTEVVSENDFAGTPFVPGGRRIMAFGEAPEYYKVELGDTLFDVCDQLIDEADYWPKLWALNPGIKNPHFIYPEMVLTFYPGDDSTPPYLQVVSEEDVLPIDTGGLREEDLVIQPVSGIVEQHNGEVAPSFEYLAGEGDGSKDESGSLESEFETIGERFDSNSSQIVVPAFFFDDEVEPIAEVVAGPKGEFHIQEGGDLIIEADEGRPALGTSYSVVRETGKIKNAEGDTIGYRYEFVAQIRVNMSTADEDAYVAKVIKSRLGVLPGDYVIEYKSVNRTFTRGGNGIPAADASATVLGFEYPVQYFAGQGQLVYLDKPFSPGSTIPVYQKASIRIPSLLRADVPEVEYNIGFIRIIDNIGRTSLGIVLQNTLDIRYGDALGRG